MKNNIFLSGNFAPVHEELNIKNLEVIGEIPADLNGTYMRNGPNPEFPPISYTYPFDGDGMIHAINIEEGNAHYRNRFVETKGLIKERKAGHALYGGVLNPLPMAPEWADPEDEPVAFKNGAFIHVIHYAGHYLAMSEGAPAYVMTKELNTLGEWTLTGESNPISVCAHTRLDPVTGDLWFVNYAVMPPYLSIYHIDQQGKLVKKYDIEKPYSTMIHDFVMTENYVVVFDCPVIIDIEKIMSGESVINWRPELGVRIGVMQRKSGIIQWFETEAFFVFHFANAYEQDNNIIIDFVRHASLDFIDNKKIKNDKPPHLHRCIIDLKTGQVKHQMLDERLIEFPRIRENIDTKPHRYIYSTNKTNSDQLTFNALIKYDVVKQTSQIHDFDDHVEIGEAVFAPAKSQKSEDDGYLMLFTYNNIIKQSEFVILDAQDITIEPLARVIMPCRVPHGLHGSWVPE